MEKRRIYQVAATVWATAGLINGASAAVHHNRAVYADDTVKMFEQYGRDEFAAVYRDHADDIRGERNFYGGLAALNFSLAGLLGFLGRNTSRTEKREEVQAETEQRMRPDMGTH